MNEEKKDWKLDGVFLDICLLILMSCVIFITFTIFFNNMESPEDVVKSEDIKVYQDYAVINFSGKKVRWASIVDTNSMIPTFDYGHNVLEMVCPCDIKQGDIISYHKEDYVVIHRVVKVGIGKYKTKGDNNWELGEWVNESNVISKVVAIIY